MNRKLRSSAAMLAALALAVSILSGCGGAASSTAESAPVETPEPTPQYSTETVTLTGDTVVTNTDFAGEVEADDDTPIVLNSYVNGYRVKQILVKAGDAVEENQIIAKLDTADLDKRIAKAQSAYDSAVKDAQSKLTKAQDTYDKAKSAYDTAYKNQDANKNSLRDKMNQASGQLDAYKATKNTAQTTYDSAKSKYDSLQKAYQEASAQLNYLAGVLKTAGDEADSAQKSYYKAQDAWDAAFAGSDYDAAYMAFAALVQSSYYWNGDADGWRSQSYSWTPADDPSAEPRYICYEGNCRMSWEESAQGQYAEAEANYAQAEDEMCIPSMNLYGMDAINEALDSAKSSMNSAKKALDAAQKDVDSAQTKYNDAKKAYDSADDTVNDLKKKMNDASTALTSAQAALDKAKSNKSDINDLNSLLTLCDVRSPVSGVVYSIDTEEGGVCGENSLLTVDNVESLDICVEITQEQAEEQIIHMALGCTVNGTIPAVVYQCSTTPEDDGKYYAYIRPVDEDEKSIKYGDKVTVSIPTSSEFLYTVPGAAIGTNNGQNYVLAVYEGEYYSANVTVKGTDAAGNCLVAPQGLTQGIEIAANVALVDPAKVHVFTVNTDLDTVEEGTYADYADDASSEDASSEEASADAASSEAASASSNG